MTNKRTLDTEAAHRVLIAFAGLWRYVGFERPPAEEVGVMFSVAERRRESVQPDYSSLSRQSSKDVVMLEFEPGAEMRGPWNVAVCVGWGGEIVSLPECRLWEDPRGRVRTLMPRGEEFCIAFDGSSLRMVPHLPEGDLRPGFAAAGRRLRAAAKSSPRLSELPARVIYPGRHH